MLIENDLQSVSLPPKYKRNGHDCFFDPYREKLIPVTPEEIIHQKIAAWMESTLDVPRDCIILEQHLSHYQIDSKDRLKKMKLLPIPTQISLPKRSG